MTFFFNQTFYIYDTYNLIIIIIITIITINNKNCVNNSHALASNAQHTSSWSLNTQQTTKHLIITSETDSFLQFGNKFADIETQIRTTRLEFGFNSPANPEHRDAKHSALLVDCQGNVSDWLQQSERQNDDTCDWLFGNRFAFQPV